MAPFQLGFYEHKIRVPGLSLDQISFQFFDWFFLLLLFMRGNVINFIPSGLINIYAAYSREFCVGNIIRFGGHFGEFYVGGLSSVGARLDVLRGT